MTVYSLSSNRKPESGETIIWRYMDWWKLESMLDRRALFFSRADKQDDPWEGHVPESTYKRVRFSTLDGKDAEELFRSQGMSSEELVKILTPGFIEVYNLQRRLALLSCWHVNPTESSYMWRAYTSESNAVAIQTTVGDLWKCLENSPDGYFCVDYVRYAPLANDYIPIGDMYLPFFRKEPRYSFERELRVLRWNSPTQGRPLNEIDWDEYERKFPTGAFVRIDPKQLIKSVYLLPDAPADLREKTTKILRHHGLNDVEVQSSEPTLDPQTDT